jgi:hypothetical protein
VKENALEDNMKKNHLFLTLILLLLVGLVTSYGQGTLRQQVDVPWVDPESIKLDGVMDEPVWQDAARADMITGTGFQIWTNKYYRESLLEPDYDEMYGRMLWSKDTLFVFMHIDEFVNDSTDLFWAGQWTGDQLFISLSSRLAVDMMGWYDGNVYAVPEGPYHFLILGDQVTLNMGVPTFVPEDYRCNVADSLVAYNAADYARWGVTIDKATGIWNVEMAIYNPHIVAQSAIAFNIGGSTGSTASQAKYGDAYAYYTWQPNVPDEPYSIPAENDPGYFNLASSKSWAMLNFLPGPEETVTRKEVSVPWVDPNAITLDGVMDEAAWQTAGRADMITDTGFEIWSNKYYRESLIEPDYDEMYARILWSDTLLYVFMHIDEFVNDSTDLFWAGQWTGDQLFLGLSSRLGVDMMGWYDGNVYAAPEGPYHFLIMGADVTLNAGAVTFVPEQYRCRPEDSLMVFDANNITGYGITIDKSTGVWNVEIAIANFNIAEQGRIGFNIGGSTGSTASQAKYGDAYAYYTWQPNVPDEPYSIPSENDPGYYSLVTSAYWPVLKFESSSTGVTKDDEGKSVPEQFTLSQNYPNPFNPMTTIHFDVAKTGPVTLQVFNILGEAVANLVSNKMYTPGSYSVTWDATQMASGVYIYQFKAGNMEQVKKMMLIK